MDKTFFDNMKNAERGIFFTVSEIDMWYAIACPKKIRSLAVRGKSLSLLDVSAAFDIETTTYMANCDGVEMPMGLMYIWMFGLNGAVIIGRTWEEFMELVSYLGNVMGLSETLQLPVYVHNLAYEFQFIRHWFHWTDVFATQERKIMQGFTEEGLCFKCSYTLSGKKLADCAEDLVTYKVEKKVGDLDYDKPRHSLTPLTREEMGYCINDVLVVMAYIREKMEREKNITRIPLTKTGYARRVCRNACLYPKDEEGALDTRARYKYMRTMEALKMTLDEYVDAKRASAGGFTHANAFNVGNVFVCVVSKDGCSFYPAHMCAKMYPMSRGKSVDLSKFPKPSSKKAYRKALDVYLKTYCCLVTVRFKDLEEDFIYDHYISSSRCTELSSDAVLDNGRVVKASTLELTCTEQDFDIISRTYTWKNFEVLRLRYYRKQYLPKPYIETVLDLYEGKTSLKDVEGYEEEYTRKKELLNSLFGMMLTDVCKDGIMYDGDWDSVKPQELSVADYNAIRAAKLDDYNEQEGRFLSYLWGVWVTAHSRHTLWEAIMECAEDYIYSDTDSCKFTNPEKHEQFFQDASAHMASEMEAMCKHYNIDVERTRPLTKKGVAKPLGAWETDGVYEQFKTLGAKRYMYTTKKKGLSLTISGVNKKTAVPYLLAKYGSEDEVLKNFKHGMMVPGENDLWDPVFDADGHEIKNPSGKMVHTYIDCETSGRLTDYTGISHEWREKSSIALTPTSYKLGIASEFAAYLTGLHKVFE